MKIFATGRVGFRGDLRRGRQLGTDKFAGGKAILAALGKHESLNRFVANKSGRDLCYAIDATK